MQPALNPTLKSERARAVKPLNVEQFRRALERTLVLDADSI
jgi:hypothetical protein